MNALNENRLSMAMAVQSMLNKNSSTVAAVPAFAASKTELDNLLQQIDVLSKQQEQQTTAEEKQDAANRAINAATKIVFAAKAYALDQNKPGITASFNYSKTKLERLRDTSLLSTLRLIKDNADLLASEIAPFGADALKITELQDATDAYESVNSKPKTDKANKATATAALATCFESLAKLMRKMDNMVATQQDTRKDFYTNYHSVRKVGNKKIKGKGDDSIPPKDSSTTVV
jgi:hypothetical protein